MTFDCFLFFNEFDLLELRLKTLDPVVDWFVLVEAPWTFSGKTKPLHFQEKHKDFKPWLKKIRHVVVSGQIDTANAWHREYASREAMTGGFQDANPDDWIFQSDCDEIWRPERRDELPDARVAVYEMSHCYYSLNTVRQPRHAWKGTRRTHRRHWTSGQGIRRVEVPVIHNGGWHFSFLGDAEAASAKLKAFSHTEYSDDWWTSKERLTKAIESGTDLINADARYVPVPVDDTFPKPIIEDPDRWKKHLRLP